MQLLHYNCPTEQLGKRYTLIRLLGSGGMADVYLAWDEHDHHEAAVKVIRPNVLNPKILQRFLREGKVVASLDHPHVIRIYKDEDGKSVREETFTDPNSDTYKIPYIVMEYVKGDDLKKRLVSGQAHPLDETVRIFAQLCAAVQYAHDRGVIHRDIKPANILFREHPVKGDQVVLSDFGLALQADDTHYSLPDAGTPQYMALEQWRGKPELVSDIFSLGVVLYELCTGFLPSSSRLPEKPTLLNPSLPTALDDAILCALADEPARRFACASLFWQAIQNAVREIPLAPIPPLLVTQLPLSLQPTAPSPEDKEQQASAPSIPAGSLGNAVFPVEELPVSSQLPNRSAEADIAEAKTVSLSHTSKGAKPREKLRLLASRPISPHPTSPKRYRRAMIITALSLITLLVLGCLVYLVTRSSPATITITPAGQTVQGTYQIQGVSSNPDDHQVALRQLTSTKTATDTVNATGYVETWEGVPATGMLTFSSSYPNDYGLASGTVFHTTKGIDIITDEFVTIPAEDPNAGTPGQASVKAHAAVAGTVGDIPAGTVTPAHCCVSGSQILVDNDTFSGGVDPKGYHFLQTSDITSVTNTHQAALKSEAQNDIKGQMESSEQLLGDINCNDPKTTEDVTPGDQGPANAVTSAHVTVSVTCNAEVFDANAVQTIAQKALQQDAMKNPGTGYVLAGNIVTQIQPQVEPDGSVTFSITAKGLWYYQWTDANKQALRNAIKGMSQAQAQDVLNSYPGVGKATIDISNGGTSLPIDVNQITLDVQTVNGLSGGNS